MTLKQYAFNPLNDDQDRFVDLVASRFNKQFSHHGEITNERPIIDTSDYPRNSVIWFKNDNVSGTTRLKWFYDRVDIDQLLKHTPYPYIYEEVVHFHGGLPHHTDEVIGWMMETFQLKMQPYELITGRKGSGGPFYQWNMVVHNDSFTLTGNKMMYVRNKWRNHFDEYLDIFTLPDINSL